MKKIFLLTAFILIGYFQIKAQDISTASLTWNVTQSNNLNTNTTSAYQCTFQTSGTKNIQWVQKKMTLTFTVTGVSGAWTDVNATGKIVYAISAEGETGNLTFEKDTTGTFITLDLSQSGQQRLQQRYTVGSVSGQ